MKSKGFGGLFLLVTPAGGKLWNFKYRFEGKERKVAFGAYHDISLFEARQRREQVRSLLANGTHMATIIDPKEIGGLLRAIADYQGCIVTRCALRLAPLVFVRPGELRKAEWQEINLETAEWRIPAFLLEPFFNESLDTVIATLITLNFKMFIKPSGGQSLLFRAADVFFQKTVKTLCIWPQTGIWLLGSQVVVAVFPLRSTLSSVSSMVFFHGVVSTEGGHFSTLFNSKWCGCPIGSFLVGLGSSLGELNRLYCFEFFCLYFFCLIEVPPKLKVHPKILRHTKELCES